MYLRLWHIFIQYLVNSCLPLSGYLRENFKENDRNSKKYSCGQLYMLVGGDKMCFKDNSTRFLPVSHSQGHLGSDSS